MRWSSTVYRPLLCYFLFTITTTIATTIAKIATIATKAIATTTTTQQDYTTTIQSYEFLETGKNANKKMAPPKHPFTA
jgi:hypothetical protein